MRPAPAARFLATLLLATLFLASADVAALAQDSKTAAPRPNIILILADDLGWGDLGCYGQQKIKTPEIDAIAAEGMRFTDHYAGSTVCAPSRCCLLTGMHAGHARVRGNALVPLEADDVTIAELLKGAGYTTAGIGKWGLGEAGTGGMPTRQGFASWYGYLNQTHAHNYYPDFLWRNEEREAIPGNVVQDGVATERTFYSQDLFTAEALSFLDENKAGPFFLYLAYTTPHANNEAGPKGMEVPDEEPYQNEDWPQAQRRHAAMITRLDRDVGRIKKRLKELEIEENTILLFTSDNGPHREGGADPAFFKSAGGLRGWKRDLYEGGIRVPLVVRWPERIKPGTSRLPSANYDLLPTLAEWAGVKQTPTVDGVSIASTLNSDDDAPAAPTRDHLYWEFHERGFQQAARIGRWKALRLRKDRPMELYDLENDPHETSDVAPDHPEIVERAKRIFHDDHVESPHWPTSR